MKLFDEEHNKLIEMFEKEYKGNRLDKENKELWSRCIIYQDANVNNLFLAYRKGYALGVIN